MQRRIGWRSALIGVCAAAAGAGSASAQVVLPAVDGVQVLAQPPEIAIGGESDSGSTVLELKNVGGKDLEGAALRAHEFTNSRSNRKLGAQLLFGQAMGESGTVTYALDLAAGKAVTLKLHAAGIWDSGEARAPIFLNGKQLLEVSARKQPLPFNLRLGAGPIHVPWEGKLGVRLENADAINYPIAWRLFIDGQVAPAASGSGTLPASGALSLETPVAQDHFASFVRGLFRPAQVPVTVSVEYSDPTNTKPALAAPWRPLPPSIATQRWTTRSRAEF
jgi:hypothetical protein